MTKNTKKQRKSNHLFYAYQFDGENNSNENEIYEEIIQEEIGRDLMAPGLAQA